MTTALIQIEPYSINTASTFTFANLTISGNLSSGNADLGNLATANYIAGTLITSAQPNITSIGSLVSLTVTGNITATNANLGNLVSANYSTAVLTTGNQPNITSIGSLSSLTVSGVSNLGPIGNVKITGGSTGQYLQTDGSGNLSWQSVSTSQLSNGTSNIVLINNGNISLSAGGNSNVLVVTGTGANISGTLNVTGNANVGNLGATGVVATTLAGSLTTGAQPNITSTGTLTSLTVTGNITSGNANLGNVVTANYTNAVLTTGAQPNITSTGTLTSLTVTGNITSGNANLGNVVTANYVAGTLTTQAQPNITSTGTLTSLTVTGNVTSGNLNSLGSISGVDLLLSGNLTVNGNTTYVNSTTTAIEDPLIYQGGGANNATLTSSDGFDRGTILNYYSGSAKKAFLGWKAANAEFEFGSDVSIATGVVTVTSLANILVGNANLGNAATSNYFIGSGNNLSNIQGSNVSGQVSNALVAGTVYTAAQPNITSVGTLTSVSVTGNVTAGNANLGNLATANYFSGAGNNLSNIQGSNVSGQVGNSLVAGTVYTNAQPNITSVGTLTSLTISGNLTSGNANLGNLATANYFSGSGNNLSNIQGSNVSGQVGNSLVAGTVYTAAQPNITSVGTLTSLSVTGNVSAGNANLGNLVIANYFSGSGNNLSNIQASNISGTVANANYSLYAGTVLTNDQPNITSVGTLTSLSITGNVSAGNANLGNLVTANYTTAVLTTGAQPNITSTGTLTSLSVTGNITSGNANLGNSITGNYFIGSGNNLSNIQAANISGTVANANYSLYAGTVLTNAQPNITSVGTLSGLVVTGDTTVTGNLTVTGNTTYINSNVSVVEDPIVEYGGGANGAALTTNDSKDRGSLLHYYSGSSAVDAFMGWKNGNSEFVFASNVSVANNVATINTLGNIRVGNAQLGNAATANYFIGAGNNLSNIQGANVNGQVGNSLVAGTVYTAAQPNITSVGTLSSLSMGGTLSLPALANLYIPGGSANYIIKTDGNGNLSFTAQTAAGNANIAGSNTQIFFNNANSNTLGTSANLTFNNSTNTLTTTSLVVNGTTNLGSVSNVTITGGSSNTYLKTDGAGTLSFASLPSTTVTVDSFTGNGTSASFTLSTTPTNANYTIAAVGGVMQPRAAYSISGSTITFGSTPANNAVIEVTTINSGVSVPSGGGGGSYTYSGISANTNLAKGTRYIVNTSSANLTLTLPSSASSTLGDEIGIIDGTGTAATHAITVTVSGGGNIMGSSSDMLITTNRAAFTLVYYNSTQGWILTNV